MKGGYENLKLMHLEWTGGTPTKLPVTECSVTNRPVTGSRATGKLSIQGGNRQNLHFFLH